MNGVQLIISLGQYHHHQQQQQNIPGKPGQVIQAINILFLIE